MRAIQDWSSKHGGHFHILDYAMHFDEKKTHTSMRGAIMDVKDKDGHFIIAQEKALREAGIELQTHLNQKGDIITAKLLLTKMRREMFQEICLKSMVSKLK